MTGKKVSQQDGSRDSKAKDKGALKDKGVGAAFNRYAEASGVDITQL